MVSWSFSFGGMDRSLSCRFTADMSWLSPGLPGITSGSPLLPPFSMASRERMSKSPLISLGLSPWQERHFSLKIGSTFRAKSRSASSAA